MPLCHREVDALLIRVAALVLISVLLASPCWSRPADEPQAINVALKFATNTHCLTLKKVLIDPQAYKPIEGFSQDIQKALVGLFSGPDAPAAGKDSYIILHLVEWKDDAVKKQVWLTVTKEGRWVRQNAIDGRIFGSRKIFLASVQFEVRNDTPGVSPIGYKVTVKQKRPENVENLLALLKLIVTGAPAGLSADPGFASCGWGGHSLDAPYETSEISVEATGSNPPKPAAHIRLSVNLTQDQNYVEVSSEGTETVIPNEIQLCKNNICFGRQTFAPDPVTKKHKLESAPCLHAVCTVQGFLVSGIETVAESPLLRFGPIDGTAPVSESNDSPARSADEKAKPGEIGKSTFLDEDIHWWDVSLGLQVTKVKDLEFNADDLTVKPKKVERQNLFAFYNLFPFARWERNLRVKKEWISLPSLMVGMPISGKPLDRIFVGGGIGLKKVQFFAGATFESVKRPQTLDIGDPATPATLSADLTSRRKRKLMLGISLPVRQIIEQLKGK